MRNDIVEARVPHARRSFRCICGRPVFFRNSACLACGTPLGYAPEAGRLLPLAPANDAGHDASNGAANGAATAPARGPAWQEAGRGDGTPRSYRRCANLDTACACNWLIEDSDDAAQTLCRCCRLTRTLPDLSQVGNAERWLRIEMAKRRLVSTLIALRLPVQPWAAGVLPPGLAFDLLQSLPGAPGVLTGHEDGVITIDVEEADDSTREQRRLQLHEPYRTLLGHLRHEVGHYYWQRLVEGSAWHEPFRALFGDERADYPTALSDHYERGPRADWAQQFVSAYAASHPWEDWAETWAHYLHIVDSLDTARSFGLEGEFVELDFERYNVATLGGGDDAASAEFIALLNGWMELAGVLNELSRSMGVPDFYPFVLSAPAVRKLQFVHRLVHAELHAGTSAQTFVATRIASPIASPEVTPAQMPAPTEGGAIGGSPMGG